jgi:hypothetical protein
MEGRRGMSAALPPNSDSLTVLRTAAGQVVTKRFFAADARPPSDGEEIDTPHVRIGMEKEPG